MRITLTILVLLVMVSAIGVVHYTHHARQLYNQLQVLRDKQEHLRILQTQLQLEVHTLGGQGRVERLAIHRLNMHEPHEFKVIRVTP